MEGIGRLGETKRTHQMLSGDREERNGDIEDEVAENPATEYSSYSLDQ